MPAKPAAYAAFIILLDDAAIRIAATAPLTGRKLGPPTARLRTNGSISAAPMIAASPSRPPSPNFARTQPDASETMTKSAAKMKAAVSSNGFSGVVGTAADELLPNFGDGLRVQAAA